MNQSHDPVRQLNYIQQSLSQSKSPIGFFLAAGCPLSIRIGEEKKPLIPDIKGLTDAIREKFKTPTHKFQMVMGHFSEDGNPNPNIEDILSHIRLLKKVAGRGSARGLSAEELKNMDSEISTEIVKIVNKSLPNRETPYHNIAEWIRTIPRTQPVEIFTTNYDLLMEQALEANKVPYFDGFIGSRHTFFDSYSMEEDQLPPRWARLWKLHGSVNWRQSYEESQDGNISRRSADVSSDDFSYVIHPSHLKYDESRRMPYLAMIDRLRSFLRKPHTVLISNGYSFGDEHLNDILIDGLQINSTGIIFALVYGKLENYEKAIKISRTTHNFNLLGFDEAVIGTRRAAWIEKESFEIPKEYPEIKWLQMDETDANSKKAAQFMLGDFNYFGTFLKELVGEIPYEEIKIDHK